ncbi:enoyl reductase [Angustibacter aerolatus]|uniref:Enoyl reductase n=1 Tax=Angustibacter aerolatus TaxID=1162965 RepID=A0ABQ6JBQ4_9ACTN|nr:saccharopine dehydrogenase NADP-binding domain-containing protein [Angustibacter aerolatus]GMA84879.1 enoyl reductase [Angustibacter aerolatus]
MSERAHDVVLYGATSFVGALTAEHLSRHAPPGTRVALAGRSLERLQQARSGLPDVARDWPLVVADATDERALAGLAASTRAVASTVGPYARHGLPLVEACAAAGTHYADLTGEVQFVRAAIDRCDAPARASGARLVHACGYDSVPSDLAVLLLAEQAGADGAGGLTDVTTRVRLRGGVSGGTIASIRSEVEAVRTDRAAARLARDPFGLSPNRDAEPDVPQPPDVAPPAPVGGRWTAPFVMASYNTRIVRRSNALSGWRYGRGLRYREVLDVGRGPVGALTAAGVSAGLGALVGAMLLPPGRALLDRVLPGAGQGPSQQTRDAGWFRHETLAVTESGRRYLATVSAQGDPGYAATAVMLGEALLALGLDERRPAPAP